MHFDPRICKLEVSTKGTLLHAVDYNSMLRQVVLTTPQPYFATPGTPLLKPSCICDTPTNDETFERCNRLNV